MIEFKIANQKNPNIAYINIYEGNINLETGIRFNYTLLDNQRNIIEKRLFVINGDDFSEIGKSGQDTRISILALLLKTTESDLLDS